jgi:hypothetical protein
MITDVFYYRTLDDIQERYNDNALTVDQAFRALLKLLIWKESGSLQRVDEFWNGITE